ncbi:MAG: hypothetical protein ABSA75_10740 [Candidatus Bathyarchaeia archaeon]
MSRQSGDYDFPERNFIKTTRTYTGVEEIIGMVHIGLLEEDAFDVAELDKSCFAAY